MKRVRTRLWAVMLASTLGAAALGTTGTAAQAISDPAIPILTLDHTIPSRPWPSSGTNANDVEGLGYVSGDNSIWVADDNRDRIYELDATTGDYKSQIGVAAFQAALAVGDLTIPAGTPSDLTRADDLESIVYDPDNDVLYVTSGTCCSSTQGTVQPPYNPTVYKLTRVSGSFQPTTWQALPEGQDPTAAGWRPGGGMYFGKSNKIKTYNYATNAIGPDITLPASSIIGLHFTDANTAFVTTSSVSNTHNGTTTAQSDATIRRFNISGSTWALAPGWTFPLKGTGLIDARDLTIVGDTFYVTDGYDYRANSDPLTHAVFVYNLGSAPAPTASFIALPTTGYAPMNVGFVDTSVGTPTSWSWTFGDGGASTNQYPTHKYQAAGTYTAKLTATNAAGSTSATKKITVKPSTALPGGYVIDGFGGIHRFRVGTGPQPPAPSAGPYWNGWDIARGFAVLANGTGGYALDGFGGIHKVRIGGGANPPSLKGVAYWNGWDIARGIALLPNQKGGYMVDGYGGVHPFSIGANAAPPAIIGNPYWVGQDMARGVTIMPDGKGGYVTDRTGKLWPFKIGSGGVKPAATTGGYLNNFVSARGSAVIFDGSGGFTADAYGGLHRFGVGTNAAPPATKGGPYWIGWDIVRGVATMPDV